MADIVIIGAGTIGTELRTQLMSAGHAVVAVATSKRVVFYRQNERIDTLPAGSIDDAVIKIKANNRQIDAVMIAMTNGNKGLDELRYISSFSDKILVTCAKAAHAYQYEAIRALAIQIGRSATVGGGTGLLDILRRRHLNRKSLSIYAVLNGTLNHIFSEVTRGDSFMRALKTAENNKYAEPNGENFMDVINGELMDVAMKAAIVYNTALSVDGEFITPDWFTITDLSKEALRQLMSRNARYRFITTFSSDNDPDLFYAERPGTVIGKCGRWHISGGFQDVRAESPWYDWLRQVDGVNNGFMTHDLFGEDTGYSSTGPGAGPVVTAAAMVRDLHDLMAA